MAILYDYNLLVDTGGNLGLWLGLSLLSLTHLFAKYMWVKTKFKSLEKLGRVDRVGRKILEYFAKKKKKELLSEKKIERSFCVQFLFLVVCFCCMLLTMLMVYSRIQLYLEDPIQTIVEVEDLDFVQFPDLIECVPNGKIDFWRNSLAKKLKQKRCQVDIYDLMDFKKKNIDELWNMSITEPTKSNAKTYFAQAIDNSTFTSVVVTPVGVCTRYSFEPVEYFGTSTVHMTFYMRPAMGFCDKNYLPFYINPPGEKIFSFSSELNVAIDAATMVNFLTSKLIKINSKQKPCTSTLSDYYICKKKCLIREIKTHLNCSLPFTPDVDVPRCATSKDAKKAYETYLKISLGVKENCHCVNPCEENIYKVITHSRKSQIQSMTTTFYYFLSSKVEKIIEIYEYSLVSLICDIANSLGLTVGLSVLTFLRFLKAVSYKFATVFADKIRCL